MNDPAIARGAIALASGSLFGLGLALAGMTRVEKVRGFLDVAGRWDPSLLFVMGGATLVHGLAWRLVARRSAPVFAPRFEVTAARAIDGRLLGGAAVFGVGWGLGGLCPGPAVVALAGGSPAAAAFVAALLAGFVVAGAARRPRAAEALAGARFTEAPPEPPAGG
jgi:uncharacterized membrane protein YedE/YeeE